MSFDFEAVRNANRGETNFLIEVAVCVNAVNVKSMYPRTTGYRNEEMNIAHDKNGPGKDE